MVRSLALNIVDAVLGWRSWISGAVSSGKRTTLVRRRIRRIQGNRLRVGDGSIIHANITFEEEGGNIRIGSRTFIGRSHLICYRSIVIGDDVIMSWGITIVDHDSHSLEWEQRKDDVREWARGRKKWDHVMHAPVIICDKVWIGFNVSILKGVTIGEGAIIAACSVVTRDVPPFSLAAGNPARVVRSLSHT
jgi:acetyltransferase-like isoleucine patch superfamily enzyme